MTTYIQRRDIETKELETVDEIKTYKEAMALVKEYRSSDRQAGYYLSQRSCKGWK